MNTKFDSALFLGHYSNTHICDIDMTVKMFPLKLKMLFDRSQSMLENIFISFDTNLCSSWILSAAVIKKTKNKKTLKLIKRFTLIMLI